MSRVLLQDIVENIRFDDLPVNWTVFIPITFNLEISINSKFPSNSAACPVCVSAQAERFSSTGLFTVGFAP
ncbi:MAG: hypothetical protein D4R88_02635 [Methanosarcinales archaeon]|nr:MAG: hypothetical protein D4R88_02635 [Methanosarcinales archaeon]